MQRASRRRRYIILGIAAALIAIVAPALAVTQPWNPATSRPGVDPTIASDSSPLTSSATRSIAVLRRTQTEDDRTLSEPLLRTLGMGGQLDGVQLAGVRSVASGWAMVPVKTVTVAPGSVKSDEICLTNGVLVGCASAAQIGQRGVALTTAKNGETVFVGSVPDGVARVRVTDDAGDAYVQPAENNFYRVVVPRASSAKSVTGPEGKPIPAPDSPVSAKLEWLAADGSVVGPASP